MDARRKDLKTLAKEGRVNIDPTLVDELLDEAVQKLLNEYAERVVREQQTAAVLTTMGTVAETFGVRGAAQLASDISNKPPILENVTWGKNAACSVVDLSKYRRELLFLTIVGCGGLLAYDCFRNNDDDK